MSNGTLSDCARPPLAIAASAALVLLVACDVAAPQDAAEGESTGAVVVAPGIDVTCGGRFPRAEAPYSQRPDGCSSWSDNPGQVRDSWGSADFRSTCNDHDRCYYTLGADADACNRDFCSGLERACRHAYCTRVGGVRVCEPTTYSACQGIAASYCAAVVGAASRVFPEAQEKQRNWEACVSWPPPGRVETFVKYGNNGTASCDVYCAGPQWGRVGRALHGVRTDTGERVDRSVTPGFLNGHALVCSCDDSRVFVKGGNNGWATCHQYCAGAEWGEVGSCVAARREDTGEVISCDSSGFLNGPQQTCWCER